LLAGGAHIATLARRVDHLRVVVVGRLQVEAVLVEALHVVHVPTAGIEQRRSVSWR
jgi:hypothetical protein